MGLDLLLFWKLNDLAGHSIYLDTLFIFLADYFQYLVGLSLFWFFRKKISVVIWALATGAFSRLVLTNIIHWFYYRPRPFMDHQVYQLFDHDKISSFPSGHAATFFAIAMVVYWQDRKLGGWFLVAASLISLARVIAGVHYPTDILAGAVVGIVAGWLVQGIEQKIASRRPVA